MSSDPVPSSQSPCQHLRSKEMYYQEVEDDNDPYASGIYWCTKTHEGFGPDGEPVTKADCCANRKCYVD